jgi:TRAP-type uncharacterized transport system substrate-binding protein
MHTKLAIFWLPLLATLVAQTEAVAQRSPYEQQMIAKLNQATIGVAAGRTEGAPLRFVTELARVVDDDDNMRVLPIVTRGPFENVHDLLYLRGIDAAVIFGDTLEHFKNDPRISNIHRRIHYITHLFPSELHLFVRPEIQRLQDLEGKAVNFNTHGTAAAYSGPLIFDRLGIKVDKQFVPHTVAMGDMVKGDKYAAVVFVSSKPLDPFLKKKWPDGFRFLPVPLTDKLEDYYLPAQLEAADYPGLIPEGQVIETISVPAVLAAYAWPEGSDRYQRLSRFVDFLFQRLPKLQSEAGYHPKWRELNLAATVPGWQRFGAVQDKLIALAAAKANPRVDNGAELKQAIARMVPGDEIEQSRLFRRYLQSQQGPVRQTGAWYRDPNHVRKRVRQQ